MRIKQLPRRMTPAEWRVDARDAAKSGDAGIPIAGDVPPTPTGRQSEIARTADNRIAMLRRRDAGGDPADGGPARQPERADRPGGRQGRRAQRAGSRDPRPAGVPAACRGRRARRGGGRQAGRRQPQGGGADPPADRRAGPSARRAGRRSRPDRSRHRDALAAGPNHRAGGRGAGPSPRGPLLAAAVPSAPRGARLACRCRKLCHLMRPGHIRGSGRRAGPAAEPGYSRLQRADAGVRRAGSAAASCAADGSCNDRRTRRGPAAGAVRR